MALRPDHVPHRNVQSGGLRAALFGVMDGIVTNTSLILGLSATSVAASSIRAAGLSGMLAGALSMAVGEYASMRGQRELLERELSIEREELRAHPEGERRELIGILRERGISEATAKLVAEELMSDEQTALEAHAREELGINPQELGSPLRAGSASLVSFLLGAFVPLIPWLAGSSKALAFLSLALAVVVSATVGSILARMASLSIARVAWRQVFLTLVAALLTFGIERAFRAATG